MKKSQWGTFGIGFFIMCIILNTISISKNKLATSMIYIDSSVFAAWKIVSDISFLCGIMLFILGWIFIICGILESKE